MEQHVMQKYQVKVADALHTSINVIVSFEIRSRISSKLGRMKVICCEIWYVMEIILRGAGSQYQKVQDWIGAGNSNFTKETCQTHEKKNSFILYCKVSVFFTTPSPPTHILFLNSTVIINFNPLEANYDLQMANPFSSALEGRGPLFR